MTESARVDPNSMEDEEGGEREVKPCYKSTLFLLVVLILVFVIVGSIIGVVLYFTVFKPSGDMGGTEVPDVFSPGGTIVPTKFFVTNAPEIANSFPEGVSLTAGRMTHAPLKGSTRK